MKPIFENFPNSELKVDIVLSSLFDMIYFGPRDPGSLKAQRFESGQVGWHQNNWNPEDKFE